MSLSPSLPQNRTKEGSSDRGAWPDLAWKRASSPGKGPGSSAREGPPGCGGDRGGERKALRDAGGETRDRRPTWLPRLGARPVSGLAFFQVGLKQHLRIPSEGGNLAFISTRDLILQREVEKGVFLFPSFLPHNRVASMTFLCLKKNMFPSSFSFPSPGTGKGGGGTTMEEQELVVHKEEVVKEEEEDEEEGGGGGTERGEGEPIVVQVKTIEDFMNRGSGLPHIKTESEEETHRYWDSEWHEFLKSVAWLSPGPPPPPSEEEVREFQASLERAREQAREGSSGEATRDANVRGKAWIGRKKLDSCRKMKETLEKMGMERQWPLHLKPFCPQEVERARVRICP